jgi:signal transduction histidine kinase
MSPEVLARAREMFFTTKPKGSGIGLALCQGVADAVAGELQVESSPGRGTTVRLTLPINAKAL